MSGSRFRQSKRTNLPFCLFYTSWLTTLTPKTRRLIKVSPEYAAATEQMFALLLGDNLDGRKSYIAENGHRDLDDLDVS